MNAHSLDISQLVRSEAGFPYPDWSLLGDVIRRSAPDAALSREAWTEAARQWSDLLALALGPAGSTVEGPHFLVTATLEVEELQRLTRFAESCRETLLKLLPGVAEFTAPGKEVVLAFPFSEEFYTYVAPFHPEEGDFGGAGGMHIRVGYPHVTVIGRHMDQLQFTLAHEITHAGLFHLGMPAWLEEGLAQMFEGDMTPRQPVHITYTRAKQHRAHWREFGLEAFWSGDAFHFPGEAQGFSYELAEILIRLLIADFRPRWFGLDRGPCRRLFGFLREARIADNGRSAAEKHLECSLEEIAAKFLGRAEDWEEGEREEE